MDRVTELLRQGMTALRVGESAQAEKLFREATEQDPTNIEAWLGLASAVASPEEKRTCFERVLTLDPNNEEARDGLEWMARRVPLETTTVPDNHHVVLHCTNHPDTETLLRCNRCDKPICMRCAVRTPVGYRCRECIAGQQRIYFTGTTKDYLITAVVGFVLAATAGLLFFLFVGGFLGFWIALLIGPAAGGSIAEIVRNAVRRRRSRHLNRVAAISVALGALSGPGSLLTLNALSQGTHLAMLLSAPFTWLLRFDLLLFVGLAVATVYARLR
jgi:tetratricopeptide (TPR) repeat protein